ncbi:MAG: MoxR family ATPase [Candidatus Marinimicrobia bacterium]|jgi:MoxR-like ATPase|nr:MoxR family ATPase [Candidatus Neomarinimicrobiota bacterium]MBT3500708.1 MoxR family ATPase [Candidatus Neomarinimicrobiota bacterium]MBT3839556.1 MoxR family ATPase [Candidatus Neomarinimicrobiota bacterium]MBT3998914.1 MoxR family ATPase [Candidatus Neomarinimicrobiota bacterium]MBT4283145.1 MoxR family ATPase [Candidatus Neomarinimicrobiota bacterium]
MTESQHDLATLEKLAEAKQAFLNEVGKVIIGQQKILDHMLIALLAKGHSLLVGVPGLAKTLLIQTLSDVLDLSFKRIQFTPDLMPSDITGTELIDIDQNTGQRSFRFFQGPIFANIVLADEINRTPPKTQAALLEAMQEHKVTMGGKTYNLDEPFFVLATQNPIEQEGTYPLPEAQLDRFMFNLNIDYPSTKDEISIVRATTTSETPKVQAIMTKEEISSYQNLVRRVPVADNVVEYTVKLVGATRPNSKSSPSFIQQSVDWGAGPRASQYLVLGAKAKAILDGRSTPDINDIRDLALPILRHRVLPNFNAEAEGLKVDDILNQLLEEITE